MEAEVIQQKPLQVIIAEFDRERERLRNMIATERYIEAHHFLRGFNQEELAGVSAYLALPESDDERNQLIDAYRQETTNNWGDKALVGMSAYLMNRTKIRFVFGNDWRNCFADAAGIATLSEHTLKVLDAAIDRMQLPDIENSHTRLTTFVDNALLKGEIKLEEKAQLMEEIEHAHVVADEIAFKKSEYRMMAEAAVEVTPLKAKEIALEKGDRDVQPVDQAHQYQESTAEGKPPGLTDKFIQYKSGGQIRKRGDHHNRFTDSVNDARSDRRSEQHEALEKRASKKGSLDFAEGLDEYKPGSDHDDN